MGTIAARARDAAASGVADALGLDPADLRPLSREPLGSGSVAGFLLGEDAGAVAYIDDSLLPVRTETGLVDGDGVRVWIHPADPHLPALPAALFGEAADILFQRLGLPAVRAVEMVGYRAGRRAVLRVSTAGDDVWMKVVRPTRVERIVSAHRVLAARGVPVPVVRGWSGEGLIVMDAAPGIAVVDLRPDPADLIEATDRLRQSFADADLGRPARTSLGQRLPWYVERLDAVMPGAAGPVAAAVSADLHSRGAATIHGDLHLGQLFGSGSGLSGVIDVDTAGTGDPADDAGAFLGHAIASALTRDDPERAAWLREVVRAAQERWATGATVRALTAVHLLGHALSAAERDDRDAARALVRAARIASRGPKTDLMTAFEGP